MGGVHPAALGAPRPLTAADQKVLGPLFLSASEGKWPAVFSILKWRRDLAGAACPFGVAARLRSGGALETLLHHAARQGNREAALRLMREFSESAGTLEELAEQQALREAGLALLSPGEYARQLGNASMAELLEEEGSGHARRLAALKAELRASETARLAIEERDVEEDSVEEGNFFFEADSVPSGTTEVIEL